MRHLLLHQAADLFPPAARRALRKQQALKAAPATPPAIAQLRGPVPRENSILAAVVREQGCKPLRLRFEQSALLGNHGAGGNISEEDLGPCCGRTVQAQDAF